jgi:glycine betaine/proline transport system ATP-binding protein
MYKDNTTISCQHLWKIFGPKPENAWKLANEGASRKEVMEKTGHVVAVKDVSFDIHENEIFVIMGLSGSGKSTVVRCINRLIDPTKGTVTIDGEDITRMDQSKLRNLRRRKLSMVFQNFGLLPHRSVLENIAFGLEIRGENKTLRLAKAMKTLEMVELQGWENSRLSELSGGMQQRVGLARALAVESEIVLMDEPFSALDPLIRRQMQDEFIKLRDKVKKTIIFITHDLVEALKLGDRIAIMKDGETVQIGTPQEIVSQPADQYVSEFVKDVPRAKLISAESIMEDPKSVIWSNYDVEVALKEMANKHTAISFITDSQYRLLGIVTMKQAIETARGGILTLGKIAQTDIPSTSPTSTLEEILHKLADSEVPVAVLDEHRHLLGIISRETVIRALKPDEKTTG